jgi:hypothetical protein
MRAPIIQWPEPTERKAPEKHRRSVAKPMRQDGQAINPKAKSRHFCDYPGLAWPQLLPSLLLQYFTALNIATECDRRYRMAGFLN